MLRLFGEKLRYLRRQRGLSQTELAQQLAAVSRAHLSHLEAAHKSPSLDLVVQLANFFSVTTDYLLHDATPVEQPQPAQPALSALAAPLTNIFSTQLRALRRAHGLTQAEFARRLDLASHSHVSFLELGRKEPSLNLVVQISDIFGISSDTLLRAPDSIADTS